MLLEDNRRKTMNEALFTMLLALTVALMFKATVIDIVRVSGSSMYPTLKNEDRIIVNRLAYVNSDPEYGDIVIVQATKYKDYVKRIIAKGGDTIEIKNGRVYLNGEVLEESYLNGLVILSDYPEITVPEGEYFVMGDNRNNSLDSRSAKLGTVTKDQIKGKIIKDISCHKIDVSEAFV